MNRNDPGVIAQLAMLPPGQRRRPAGGVFCKYHPDATLLDDAHAGDLICPECGLVVVERCIDVGSEWRTFGSDSDSKDNSRVGAAENPLLEGGDLSTSIMAGPGGAGYGADGRLTYNNRRQVSSSDRALLGAFSNIRGMADKLNLPSIIVEHSNKLFQQVHLTKQLRGRSNDAIAAACLYIACRKEDVPRTFKEICAVTVVSKKVIGRVFKLVLKIMNTNVEVTSSGDFMSRFCANLDLPRLIMSTATYIAKKAADLDLVSGRSPISAAAAAIYMASQASEFKKSAAEIGEAAGVAEMTIRQVYKLMLPSAAKLFPEDFKFAVPIRYLPSQ